MLNVNALLNQRRENATFVAELVAHYTKLADTAAGQDLINIMQIIGKVQGATIFFKEFFRKFSLTNSEAMKAFGEPSIMHWIASLTKLDFKSLVKDLILGEKYGRRIAALGHWAIATKREIRMLEELVNSYPRSNMPMVIDIPRDLDKQKLLILHCYLNSPKNGALLEKLSAKKIDFSIEELDVILKVITKGRFQVVPLEIGCKVARLIKIGALGFNSKSRQWRSYAGSS